MKIQKRFLRKHNEKDYFKYMVNIPPAVLKESGIEYGEEVEITTKNGKIVLEKKKSGEKK